MRSRHITVQIDLDRVRAAAEQIRDRTAVRVMAVIKADAYGLGAARVAAVIESVVDEFAYFSLNEARTLRRPGLILGPPGGAVQEHLDLRVRPAVSTSAQLHDYARAAPALNVDTGMGRFGCLPAQIDKLLGAHTIGEAFTHTESLAGVEQLRTLCDGRVPALHAAASSLLDTPAAWMDAVRPGLALYRDAVRVTTRLVEARDISGPIGYGGLRAERVGIILAGYSHHLQPAPVRINGRPQRILECGMQTSFVSLASEERVGDEVVLLGDEVSAECLAADAGVRPHAILCRYTSIGERRYAAWS